MNRVIYFLAVLILFSSCKDNNLLKKKDTKQAQQQENSRLNIPEMETQAEPGEFVLVPLSVFLKTLNSGNPDSIYLAFYPRKLLKKGKVESTVRDYDTVLTIPNTFIIPIKSGQKAKEGDIVLTWWQGASGMQRAYVINADNPYKPEVKYLDFDWIWENSQFKSTGTLDSNTFVVLEKEFQPGTSVAAYISGAYEYFRVINVHNDKVVLFSWSGKLAVLDKEQCLPNEVHPQIAKGDSIYVPFYGIYTQAQVKEIDQGIVVSEFDFFGKLHTVKTPLCDVRKTLP